MKKVNSPIVVTADVDWASEYCISQFVEKMLTCNIRPLLFVTHASDAINYYAKHNQISLGIHPNFRLGSDHGSSIDNVIDFVCSLVERPWISRSHGFKDNIEIQKTLVRHGVKVDSNELMFLENDIKPKKLSSGILRYPVFWSDGFELRKSKNERWQPETLEKKFDSPGLKIINIHPFNWALNFSSVEQYEQKKFLTKTINAQNIFLHRNTKKYGVFDFVDNMFSKSTFLNRVISPESLTNV